MTSLSHFIGDFRIAVLNLIENKFESLNSENYH